MSRSSSMSSLRSEDQNDRKVNDVFYATVTHKLNNMKKQNSSEVSEGVVSRDILLLNFMLGSPIFGYAYQTIVVYFGLKLFILGCLFWVRVSVLGYGCLFCVSIVYFRVRVMPHNLRITYAYKG